MNPAINQSSRKVLSRDQVQSERTIGSSWRYRRSNALQTIVTHQGTRDQAILRHAGEQAEVQVKVKE
jgi:hypothetical protein